MTDSPPTNPDGDPPPTDFNLTGEPSWGTRDADSPTFGVPATDTPFNVEPVDPLIFQETLDSPELRPAAAYVASAARVTANRPKPVREDHTDYPQWTPGGPSETAATSDTPDNFTAVRVIRLLALAIAVAIPIAVLIGAIALFTRLMGS